MNNSHLVDAYERMLGRVREVVSQESQALREAIDHAEEMAVELGELSREEAVRIGDYLHRDLHDIGDYLAESGSEFRAWFRFDVERMEEQLFDMIASVADRTSLELGELAERARAAGEPKTGQVTLAGALECTACGEQIHFTRPAMIPPCPKCHATRYRRVEEERVEEGKG